MKRGRDLLLLAVSTIFALLLAEVLLANLHPQWTARRLLESTPADKRSSEILPYHMCKGCQGRLVRSEYDTRITINSLGLRGPEVDLDGPTGQRILIVGDSFTYGFGVEDDETYPAVLQRRLEEHLGEHRALVLNGGFAAGYYPDTYYLWLKEFGLRFEPDLVIVGFYVGNDIDHSKSSENYWAEVDAEGLPTKITTPGVEIVKGHQVQAVRKLRYRLPVLRNSHLFQALATAFDRLQGEAPLEGAEERGKQSAGVSRTPKRAGGGRARPQASTPFFNHWMYRSTYLPRTTAIVAKIERLLLATAEMVRSHGMSFMVLMIPAREQLLPSEYEFERFPFMADYDLDKPQRLFAEFFEQQRIDYLDLLPLLRSEAPEPLLYYPVDAHLTRRGNELAASHLERFLLERGLVPQPHRASDQGEGKR